MKDIDRIHILIERYFDGETSLEEERELREILPLLDPGDEDVDSALAVMGFAGVTPRAPKVLVQPQVPSRSRWESVRRWSTGIAAAITIAILLFAALTSDFSGNLDAGSGEHSHVAYVNGEKIVDPNVIQAMIEEEFSQMADARKQMSDDVSEELASFKGLL